MYKNVVIICYTSGYCQTRVQLKTFITDTFCFVSPLFWFFGVYFRIIEHIFLACKFHLTVRHVKYNVIISQYMFYFISIVKLYFILKIILCHTYLSVIVCIILYHTYLSVIVCIILCHTYLSVIVCIILCHTYLSLMVCIILIIIQVDMAFDCSTRCYVAIN